MCMHHMCAWCLERSERDIRAPGAEVLEAWEIPREGLELILGALQEHPVLLTAEPALQLKVIFAMGLKGMAQWLEHIWFLQRT